VEVRDGDRSSPARRWASGQPGRRAPHALGCVHPRRGRGPAAVGEGPDQPRRCSILVLTASPTPRQPPR
jgi:hypothetical protein